MNIVVVGSAKVPFVYSYIKYFSDLGHKVCFLNTSKELLCDDSIGVNLYSNETVNGSLVFSYIKRKIKKIFSLLHIDRLNIFIRFLEYKEDLQKLSISCDNKILNILKENDIDLVFSLWGTTLRKEIKSFVLLRKNNNFKFKIVHSVNTYPVRFNFDKLRYQSNIPNRDKFFFSYFDGVIVPTHKMKSLFEDSFCFRGDILVQPDFLHKDFFDVNYCKHKPSKNALVFLGNVNFSERTIDNVSAKIIDIMDSGIELWVQSPCEIQHTNLRTFNSFSLDDIATGKLSSFISQFVGSIIFYNDLNNLRSSISYPTRFALSTLSNKPIFVESNVFDGLEEYLLDVNSPVVFYENVDQLKFYLSGEQGVIVHYNNYFMDFETHLNNFNLFIKKVCK